MPGVCRSIGARGCVLFALYLVLISASAFAQIPAREQKTQFVVPPGVESQVESLFDPHKTGEAIASGLFEGLSIQHTVIEAMFTNSDGAKASLLIGHPEAAEGNAIILKSIAVSFPEKDGVLLDEDIRDSTLALLKKNDGGDFPWKKVFSTVLVSPPSPESEARETDKARGPPGFILNLAYSLSQMAWVLVVLLTAFFLVINRKAISTVLRNSPQEAAILGLVLLLGTLLRTWYAPQALYKEAYHFRYLWVVADPLWSSPEIMGRYPLGLHQLYQLIYAATGIHPVDILFGGNLVFGCFLPFIAAFLGWRLNRNLGGAILYAAAAAFLPHAVKYAPSEALTGPFTVMLLFAFLLGTYAHRSLIYGFLLGLVLGLATQMRPESVVIWPGIFLWLYGTKKEFAEEEQPEASRVQGIDVAIIVAVLISLVPILRVGAAQLGGEGVGMGELGVLGLGQDASFFSVLLSVLQRIVDPDWSAIFSSSFTPPPIILMALLGGYAFYRRASFLFLGLLITYLSLASVYAFMSSSLENTGEMRYHLSLVAVLIVFTGSGATEVCRRFSGSSSPIRLHAFAAAGMALCFVPYMSLVQNSGHPFQQEFLVLKEEVLEKERTWADDALVLVPPPNEYVIDITPTTVKAMLSDPGFRTRVLSWSEIKIEDVLKDAKEGIPVYFYMGLYSHYLVGHKRDGIQWWTRTMGQLGISMDSSEPPYLEPLFVEERPFVPNHQILDKKFGEGTLRLGLFQLKL